MMNAREISDWFSKEKEQALSESERQAELLKKRSEEAQLQRKKELETELSMIDREVQGIGVRIATLPPVYLHNRFDMTCKRRMKTLLASFDSLEIFLASGFNRGLLSFGSPWFTMLSIIASIALAFQWIQNRFGLDGIGGSELVTMLVTAGAAFSLDLIAFLLLSGLFAGLKNFLERKRHVEVLERIMVGAALLGVAGFGIILFQRFMEAGL